MEYCDAGDLYDYIKTERYFTERKVASIISQLFSALAHLHKMKMVHRDIKPENIVLFNKKGNQDQDQDEVEIKIIDFGTSAFLQKNERISQEIGSVNKVLIHRHITSPQKFLITITMRSVMYGQLV